MSVHAHLAPKMRIDVVEDRIDVVERLMNALRSDNQRLTEMVFSLASQISETEAHQNVLRSIMARMAHKMEVLKNDVADDTPHPESTVRHMDETC